MLFGAGSSTNMLRALAAGIQLVWHNQTGLALRPRSHAALRETLKSRFGFVQHYLNMRQEIRGSGGEYINYSFI